MTSLNNTEFAFKVGDTILVDYKDDGLPFEFPMNGEVGTISKRWTTPDGLDLYTVRISGCYDTILNDWSLTRNDLILVYDLFE